MGCGSKSRELTLDSIDFYKNGVAKSTEKNFLDGKIYIKCEYYPNALISNYSVIVEDTLFYSAAYDLNGECYEINGAWGMFLDDIITNDSGYSRLHFMVFPRFGYQKIFILENMNYKMVKSFMHLDQKKVIYDTLVIIDWTELDSLKAVFGHRDTISGETFRYNYTFPKYKKIN